MRILLKVLVMGCVTFLMTQSYAIQVNVRTNANEIEGLGFTVNGAEHGGMGNSYQGVDMPKGSYAFGLRDKEGKNIPCFTKNGKKSVQLSRNANAYLTYNGRRCMVSVGS